jgi:hypothetical protein
MRAGVPKTRTSGYVNVRVIIFPRYLQPADQPVGPHSIRSLVGMEGRSYIGLIAACRAWSRSHRSHTCSNRNGAGRKLRPRTKANQAQIMAAERVAPWRLCQSYCCHNCSGGMTSNTEAADEAATAALVSLTGAAVEKQKAPVAIRSLLGNLTHPFAGARFRLLPQRLFDPFRSIGAVGYFALSRFARSIAPWPDSWC